jgi:hypothetical protein
MKWHCAGRIILVHDREHNVRGRVEATGIYPEMREFVAQSEGKQAMGPVAYRFSR